jgi:2-keto-4-pentenoate hydratase
VDAGIEENIVAVDGSPLDARPMQRNSMTFSSPDMAAQWLFDEHSARRSFVPIPGRQDGDVLDKAYDVQDRLVDLLTKSSGSEPAGYKIGLTTPRMQHMCGIDHPIAGVVLANRVHNSPVTVNSANFVRLGIECELAVKLSRPLTDSPITVDQVQNCISAVAAAFELVEDRSADYRTLDLLSLVADNSWNGGIVLGQPMTLQNVGNLNGTLSINGQVADRGNSRDVLGNPLAAVAWLADHLARRNQSLAPGQWVMTGSIVPTKFAKSGDRFVFSLGPLDPVDLTIQ